jgi:hypothetical protein
MVRRRFARYSYAVREGTTIGCGMGYFDESQTSMKNSRYRE